MRCLEPEWRASLPSTNTWLLERLRHGEELPSGYVVAAREQTAGRGWHDRGWVAAPGRDLTFSVLVYTDAEARVVLSAPMAAALGVVSALAAACGVAAQPKWPNDVLVNDRKICGILAERAGPALVIGIGINVNMTADEAARIDQPATSVLVETGRTYPAEEVLGSVLQGLSEWLSRWENGGFSSLSRTWAHTAAQVGRWVSVRDGTRRIHGRLTGFGEWGQALLTRTDGTVTEAWAGRLDRA